MSGGCQEEWLSLRIVASLPISSCIPLVATGSRHAKILHLVSKTLKNQAQKLPKVLLSRRCDEKEPSQDREEATQGNDCKDFTHQQNDCQIQGPSQDREKATQGNDCEDFPHQQSECQIQAQDRVLRVSEPYIKSDRILTEQEKYTFQQAVPSQSMQADDQLDIESIQILDESIYKELQAYNTNRPGVPFVDVGSQFVTRIEGKKRQPKITPCFFCKKNIVDKMKRYVESVHKNEDIMKKARSLGEKAYLEILAEFMSRGRALVNAAKSSEGGELILARRPNFRHIAVSATDYAPCSFCFKYLKKKSLRKQHCAKMIRFPEARGLLKNAESLVPNINPAASQRLRELVLPHITRSKAKDIVKQDHILVLFGNDLIDYYTDPNQATTVVARELRTLAELFHVIQQKNPEIEQWADLLSNDCVDIVKNGLALSNYIGKLAEFCYHFCSKNSDLIEAEAKVEKFQKCFKYEFKMINKKSRDARLEKARSRPVKRLPSTESIQVLDAYIQKKMEEAYKKLTEEGFSYLDRRTLNEATELSIQVFNRKRTGDISKLLISDLNENNVFKMADEELEGTQLDSINLIIELRESAKIPKSSPYVFARRGYDEDRHLFFEASRALSDYATACNVEEPDLLTETNLRKHLATLLSRRNMSQDDLKAVAHFMGHDLEIYKQYYRQPVAASELQQLVPILKGAKQPNEVHQVCQGTSLGSEQSPQAYSEYAPESSAADESLSVQPQEKEITNSFGWRRDWKSIKTKEVHQVSQDTSLESEQSLQSHSEYVPESSAADKSLAVQHEKKEVDNFFEWKRNKKSLKTTDRLVQEVQNTYQTALELVSEGSKKRARRSESDDWENPAEDYDTESTRTKNSVQDASAHVQFQPALLKRIKQEPEEFKGSSQERKVKTAKRKAMQLSSDEDDDFCPPPHKMRAKPSIWSDEDENSDPK
ncbi:hypothetical protein QAD02_008072 [Eretmocerus hayati]|uniref:Uncharacterized protein n=1 Tax=Eretmocerus hayati TaxID=131215 RepID=A0ACC2N5F2_9HYME|nr:hypothetical protein QAD02_008072 [Eretmocerus hayati]